MKIKRAIPAEYVQELLDLSNDINYQQQLRGTSTRTWSHGPDKRRRPPRPPLRSLPTAPSRQQRRVGTEAAVGQEDNSTEEDDASPPVPPPAS